MEIYLAELDLILSNLFARYRRETTVPGVLLSGGIDSSTVTLLLSQAFPDYRIFSMGTKDTRDRQYVDIMSQYLKHEYTWVDLTDEEIKDNMNEVVSLLEKADVSPTPMQVSLAMGYFLIFKEAARSGIVRIFTGQGPDVTFAGYHKYKSTADLAGEITRDLPLLEVDKRRDGAMAARFGIKLVNPYLEPDMVEFALKVPDELKIHDGVEKYLLRKYAEKRGMPAKIVARPKKAFQYSTGLQKAVNKHYVGL